MTEDRCEMRHTKPAKATGVFEGRAVCTRHLNRALQDDRIWAYVKRGPRCPTHPDREPGVTRWHGQTTPFLYCPTPAGEKVYHPPAGKGIFRTPGGSTYTGWCEWKAEIPVFVVKGMDKDLLREIQVLRAIADLEDTGNHLANASAALGIAQTVAAHARNELLSGGYLEWQYFEDSVGLLKRQTKTIAVTDRGKWLIDAAEGDPWE